MITATKPAEKRALAKALELHDPETLAAIKMLSVAIGGTQTVFYENDSRDKQDKIERDFTLF